MTLGRLVDMFGRVRSYSLDHTVFTAVVIALSLTRAGDRAPPLS